MPYPTTHKEWLAKLVSFDTTSCNSNLEVQRYIEDYLKTFGIKSEYVYSPCKKWANLWATLPGSNGSTNGGIVLSGHTDVVPVDGQKWNTDPFTVTEKDGKLYGRGTSDMKGFLAVCLALTPTFMKMKRAKPIHFAWSYGEEIGCVGVPYLTDELKRRGFKADACLVGDGEFSVCTGTKGLRSWKVKVTGKAIHSSLALMNTSCNAIEYAAMIIAKIRAIAIDLRDHGPQDKDYNCPFCSMSVGLIKGGNAVNTVPAECEFDFSIRVIKTSVADEVGKRVQEYISKEILPAMRKEAPEANVEMTPQWFVPAFNADESHPLTMMVRKLMNDYSMNKLSGGTESGFFMDLGIPTINVGVGGFKVHMSNEHTTVDLLNKNTKVTLAVVQHVTSGDAWAKL